MDIFSYKEDLSDEQIYVLLEKAKSRAQEKSNSTKESVQSIPNLPKLDTGDLPQPYVRSIGDIAHADPSRLVRKEDRDLSNRARKVKDPLTVKKQLAEVCHVICHIHHLFHPRPLKVKPLSHFLAQTTTNLNQTT